MIVLTVRRQFWYRYSDSSETKSKSALFTIFYPLPWLYVLLVIQKGFKVRFLGSAFRIVPCLDFNSEFSMNCLRHPPYLLEFFLDLFYLGPRQSDCVKLGLRQYLVHAGELSTASIFSTCWRNSSIIAWQGKIILGVLQVITLTQSTEMLRLFCGHTLGPTSHHAHVAWGRFWIFHSNHYFSVYDEAIPYSFDTEFAKAIQQTLILAGLWFLHVQGYALAASLGKSKTTLLSFSTQKDSL